jgi:hypothetical protein
VGSDDAVSKILITVGACCESFFCVFVPFLAGFLFQSSFFSESRLFTWSTFSYFVTNLDRLAGQPIQILFQILFQIMDSNSQARGGCGGCSGGVPNYKNEILIDIVESILPQGLKAWWSVAAVRGCTQDDKLYLNSYISRS